MTNTLNNVPRELLERAAYTLELAYEVDTPTVRDIRALLSAPSPADHVEDVRAMVDTQSHAGVDGLEVVAWMMKPDLYDPYVCIRRDSDCFGSAEPLCLLSGAQAIIDGLRGEVEVMTHNANNYSRMFEECAEERDQQAQRIGELEGLLYEASGELRTDRHHGLRPRIDTALSAGKEGE